MTACSLAGARIITPSGVLRDHALVIEGGMIREIPPADAPCDAERRDLDGGWLAPGFIDVQVNGGGGVLLNDEPTVEGMAAIARAHLPFGTTGLLPTLISDDLPVIARALDAADEALRVGVPGVLGVHIEGPFLNADRRGIHDASKFRKLDAEAMALLTRPFRGRRVLTLAPELAPEGAIRALTAAGVIVCAGHSQADYAQTRAALDEGLAGFTHLFNAMTQLGSREPGMVGAALEDRRSRFGLIVDGVHVHPATLRIALRARGFQGAMLVTDAMPTVGSTSPTFRLGDRVIHADGPACRSQEGTLAGSNLNMATAFANAVGMLGLSVPESSFMASASPASFLGITGVGVLKPGARADVVHLGDDGRLISVWSHSNSRASRD